MTNLLIALAGFIILSLPWPPSSAWLRSRQPAPTCGNCRYFARHLDGTFCDRRAIWRQAIDPVCNIMKTRIKTY